MVTERRKQRKREREGHTGAETPSEPCVVCRDSKVAIFKKKKASKIF